MVKRLTLMEHSADVRAEVLKDQKLAEAIRDANEAYRRCAAVPVTTHVSHIESLAEGASPIPGPDHALQLREYAQLCRDLNEAREPRNRTSVAVKTRALGSFCKTFLHEENEILKRVANSSVALHAALCEYQELKDYLVEQGGLMGICLTDTERAFGHPNDRTSDFAFVMRELVALGALKELPKAFR